MKHAGDEIQHSVSLQTHLILAIWIGDFPRPDLFSLSFPNPHNISEFESFRLNLSFIILP